MILLSLLLSTIPVDSQYLLTCEQYDWLKDGVFQSTILSPSEKLEFIFRFADGTDPKCFEENL